MRWPAVEAVLFDLDDTLYDHRHAARRAVTALRRSDPRLRRTPLGELLRCDQEALDQVHRDLVLTGRVTGEAARVERVRAFYGAVGIRVSRAEALRRARYRRRAYFAHRRPVPGSRALLAALRRRGVRVGIVTNNLLREQRGKLRWLGIDQWIDALTVSEEAGIVKPDPRIFEIALRRLGTDPARAVMVGDSWAVDIEGARTAGLRAVWLARGRPSPRETPRGVRVLASFRPLATSLETILGPGRRGPRGTRRSMTRPRKGPPRRSTPRARPP